MPRDAVMSGPLGEAERPGLVAHFCNLSSLVSGQEDKKCKAVLCYTHSSRPASEMKSLALDQERSRCSEAR